MNFTSQTCGILQNCTKAMISTTNIIRIHSSSWTEASTDLLFHLVNLFVFIHLAILFPEIFSFAAYKIHLYDDVGKTSSKLSFSHIVSKSIAPFDILHADF